MKGDWCGFVAARCSGSPESLGAHHASGFVHSMIRK
jgi:hypothetical protein